MPVRNRDLTRWFLQAMAAERIPVRPWPFRPVLTSVAREWSRLTGIKMERMKPHPRPWDGPLPGWATEEIDGTAFFDVDRADRPGGTYSNLLGYKP